MSMWADPLAPHLLRRLASEAVPRFDPPADILVDDGGVTVYMDVPGLRPEDIEVELEGDALIIRGERRFPYGNQEDRAVRRVERGFGRFQRSLGVPRGLDPEAIRASLTDGVLELHVPKPESLKPQRVQVRGSSETRELEGSPT